MTKKRNLIIYFSIMLKKLVEFVRKKDKRVEEYRVSPRFLFLSCVFHYYISTKLIKSK